MLTLGEQSARASEAFGLPGRHFTDIDELIAAARRVLDPGVTVLVKGSRFMRMERVVGQLAATPVDGVH